jgi:hypothetical protein
MCAGLLDSCEDGLDLEALNVWRLRFDDEVRGHSCKNALGP